ncbi:MAG: sigma-70 family RNA polymerase sigma factor [Candidatus Andersenbacteria bacterium]|nr:sigma-70 family RNA polymerase sigma factor [Candidatus Andersenbacteria bacterium]
MTKTSSLKNTSRKIAVSQGQRKAREAAVTPLAAYLREIGRVELLTAPQEQELAKKIQAGDRKARTHMMKANLRLVVNIAKQYSPRNEPDVLMDLIQEGNIGLMRAVDRFKPEFGTRFSTYGVYWIRQAILRALKSRRLVRLPENVVDRMLLMQRTRQKLYQMLGRDPSGEELAKEMKTSSLEIERLEIAANDIVSLESTVRGSDEGETSLQELISDNEADEPQDLADSSFMQQQVQAAVATLPPRERRIVDARFGLSNDNPKTLEEIGEDFGISRERVRQLQNVALERLRTRHAIRQAR